MLRTPAILLLVSLSIATGCAVEPEQQVVVEEIEESEEPVVVPASEPVCQEASWVGDFEVGTGEDCFDELQTDDSIALMAGPQGGYHIWIALRCRDCELHQQVQYGVQDLETGAWMSPVGEQQTVATMLTLGDYREGAGIQAGMPGDSWDSGDPEYLGKQFRILASIVTADNVVESEVVVTVDRVENWSPCSGGNSLSGGLGGNGC